MIPAESAHDTIEALGDVGLLEFKDLNPDKSAFQRTYASQVREIWDDRFNVLDSLPMPCAMMGIRCAMLSSCFYLLLLWPSSL